MVSSSGQMGVCGCHYGEAPGVWSRSKKFMTPTLRNFKFATLTPTDSTPLEGTMHRYTLRGCLFTHRACLNQMVQSITNKKLCLAALMCLNYVSVSDSNTTNSFCDYIFQILHFFSVYLVNIELKLSDMMLLLRQCYQVKMNIRSCWELLAAAGGHSS